MTSWVETMKENDFTAHASASERRIQVSLTGTADLTVKSQLDRFLREVHGGAALPGRGSHRRRAPARVHELVVPQVLRVVDQHRAGTTRRGKYRIVFVSSPSVYWQRRSLNALACLANDIITIQA
jgi:hypothetical protein